jgi:cobaltochelatase CobT
MNTSPNRGLVRQAYNAILGLPIYAQALARQFDVEIRFDASAQTGSTNGKRITLPRFALPQDDRDEPVLVRLKAMLYGLVVHEIGHVRHTDFRPARPAGGGRSIYQSIEDTRQEVEVIREYPGARHVLDEMCQHLIAMGWHGMPDGSDPAMLVSMTVNAWMRAEYRQQADYEPLRDANLAKIREVLGAGVAMRLEAILADEGAALTSTTDSIAMTNTILTMLQDEQDQAEQEAQQGGSDEQDENAGSDDSTGQGGSSDRRDSADAGDGSEQTPGSGEAAAEAGEGSGTPGSGAPASAAAQARADAIAQARQSTSGLQDAGDLARDAVATATREVQQHGPSMIVDAPPTEGGAGDGTQRLALDGRTIDPGQVALEAARLKRQLVGELQASVRTPTALHVRGRKVSRKHLSRVAKGDARIFVRRQTRKQIDTAVSLLIDVSGSMEGPRVELASQALYAAATALEVFPDVVVSATTFPGCGRVLRFGERASAHRARFALSTWGGTPLVEGLITAGRDLAGRREKRKLLIVLTDGEPSQAGLCQALIKHLSRTGLEVYGIGIQHTAVTSLFPQSAVIGELGQLSTAVIGLLRRTLSLPLAS